MPLAHIYGYSACKLFITGHLCCGFFWVPVAFDLLPAVSVVDFYRSVLVFKSNLPLGHISVYSACKPFMTGYFCCGFFMVCLGFIIYYTVGPQFYVSPLESHLLSTISVLDFSGSVQ